MAGVRPRGDAGSTGWDMAPAPPDGIGTRTPRSARTSWLAMPAKHC